ncbi:MAG: hypothetical protein IK017_09940 [Paludibacteraceae bacterium]|nr:hypothetical protein [Paludibacteraceae bacterium]
MIRETSYNISLSHIVDLDFRFSAKETDRETGLSYFGARGFYPTVSVKFKDFHVEYNLNCIVYMPIH